MKNTEEVDSPVVLVVGLHPCPASLSEQIRSRVDGVTRLLVQAPPCPCNHADFPKNYHLVVANFFPWVTPEPIEDSGWSVIEQTIMEANQGNRDPLAHIVEICKRLGGNLRVVIFHGIGVVLLLGTEFLKTHAATLWKEAACRPEIVFCDSLVTPPQDRTPKAVRLCFRHDSGDKR